MIIILQLAFILFDVKKAIQASILVWDYVVWSSTLMEQ